MLSTADEIDGGNLADAFDRQPMALIRHVSPVHAGMLTEFELISRWTLRSGQAKGLDLWATTAIHVRRRRSRAALDVALIAKERLVCSAIEVINFIRPHPVARRRGSAHP